MSQNNDDDVPPGYFSVGDRLYKLDETAADDIAIATVADDDATTTAADDVATTTAADDVAATCLPVIEDEESAVAQPPVGVNSRKRPLEEEEESPIGGVVSGVDWLRARVAYLENRHEMVVGGLCNEVAELCDTVSTMEAALAVVGQSIRIVCARLNEEKRDFA